MASYSLKAIAIWLVIVIMAIVNAAIREAVLIPTIGSALALPVSGLLLSAIVFLIAFIAIPWFNSAENKIYITVGIIWFMLTLLFEVLFGYFVTGKTWSEIVQVFDLRKGDLFILVLLMTLIAPWLSAKIRSII